MAISFCVCATPRWTNSSIPSVKQCKFVGQSVSIANSDHNGDKLRNYCPVDDVLIHSNPKNSRDVKAQVDDEDMAVMNHISSDD
ncbi:hypothetical protein SLEP1_g1420 [Rubroshorea leprosula]|uniref:Uncharacterized protein n=1 Tax=Rubroshorea leprosula TaxID=152421 RepID=A0AAV5HMH9_9ROSI|nr:hypothetical protein SLEP1_g1420 [Rubroshorea leprosula]